MTPRRSTPQRIRRRCFRVCQPGHKLLTSSALRSPSSSAGMSDNIFSKFSSSHTTGARRTCPTQYHPSLATGSHPVVKPDEESQYCLRSWVRCITRDSLRKEDRTTIRAALLVFSAYVQAELRIPGLTHRCSNNNNAPLYLTFKGLNVTVENAQKQVVSTSKSFVWCLTSSPKFR